MILMEFLDLIMVDNHFKYLHNLFIIKNSQSFTCYYFIELEIFHWILNQMLLDLRIAFSTQAQARISVPSTVNNFLKIIYD